MIHVFEVEVVGICSIANTTRRSSQAMPEMYITVPEILRQLVPETVRQAKAWLKRAAHMLKVPKSHSATKTPAMFLVSASRMDG